MTAVFVSVSLVFAVLAPLNAFSDSWTSGIKQGFGTSYESYDSQNRYSPSSSTAPISRVWFTAAQGVLTEVYWPTLDMPQLRDSQFLITTAAGDFIEERKSTVSRTEWVQEGVPAFRITNRDPRGRFTIERTIFTDPDRDSVILQIRIERFEAGLAFYLLHNASVSNSPFGDSARVGVGARARSSRSVPGEGLFAWQGEHAQAVVASIPFTQATAGFAGTMNDGWRDLNDNRRLDSRSESAIDGNVVLTARMGIPPQTGVTRFNLVLGFGNTIASAYSTARETLDQGTDTLLNRYSSQWTTYQNRLKDLSTASLDGGAILRASIPVLKSMEDKTYAGGFVASPTIPWGDHQGDSNHWQPGTPRRNQVTGGYHLVWPRDLYQMATAFLALEDGKTAVACLDYLRDVQYGPEDGTYRDYGLRNRPRNGAFPQNSWVNGEDYWGGLQMDQVGMPIVLAYKLWQKGLIQPSAYWDMVRRAGDFIRDAGPWTAQERWEESFGASPSTIAAQIAALWTSAAFADQMGDTGRAISYRQTADSWNSKPGDNLGTWTFTTRGAHGNGRYFTRIEGAADILQTWNPEDDRSYRMANGAGVWHEFNVLDGGFLELVRFGVRSALDPQILDTLPEYDSDIGVDIPGHGRSFHRYSGDRYNYDPFTGDPKPGMPWPLLTGERGHYELARAVAEGRRDPESAINPYIRAMEKFATEARMIPEQVWREGPGAGDSTGAATPLGWAHGEYVKLLRSKTDRRIFDSVPIVEQRTRMLGALTYAERNWIFGNRTED